MRPPSLKPRIGEQFDPTHWTHQGCVGAWLLNEGMGTRVADVSPRRNHAAFVNTPTWISLFPNQYKGLGPGLQFNGSNQRLNAPFIRSYDNVANALSIEAVVRVRSNLGATQGIFGRGDLGASAGTWGLSYLGASARFIFKLGGTTVVGRAFVDDFYYHLIATWDGAFIRLYERGTDGRAASGLSPIAMSSFTPSGTDDLNWGYDAAGHFLAGDIGYTRLWMNRCLRPDEIKELYAKPFLGWLPALEDRSYLFLGPHQSLQMRSNIKATVARSLQTRANIHGVSVQTLQMRASIFNPPPSLRLRASIAEPETVADGIIDSWEVSDTFGEFSRQFSLSATEIATFGPGNEVRIKAGYDENRITLINAATDQVTVQTGTDNVKVSVSGRDAGAREIAAVRITYTWKADTVGTLPKAHQVVTDAAAAAGLGIGVLDFPNYDLYQPFVAIGRTVLEIVAELAEPFNQFARVQYVTQIRDRLLSVRKIDYLNVPSGGYPLTREEHASQGRVQRLYLDEPRLNETDFFLIRGASWTTPKTDLGTTTKVEYSRTVATEEVQASVVGVVQSPADVSVVTTTPAITKDVITESTVVSVCYGDKVLTQTHEEVIDDVLSHRSIERYWYFEPGESVQSISGDVDLVSLQSATPSSAALLWLIHTKRWALVDHGSTQTFVLNRHTLNQVGAATVFIEKFREVTQYHYNDQHEVITEVHTTQTFDEDTGRWEVTNHDTRTHSQVTGGNVRTTLLKYTFEDSRFKLDTADVQNVGGTRPKPNAPASKLDVITHQAQAPMGELDAQGQVIDFGQGRYIWSFENAYIGQSVCDDRYAETLRERDFQLAGYRWEELQFEGVLNPNIRAGQPLSIEVADGVFKDYWAVNVQHQFTWNHAATSGTARRLTLEDLA
jgi:hypothetical protein